VKLLLVGRSETSPAVEERMAALDAGGDVAYLACDVADAEALEAGVRQAEQSWGEPLAGVLHLAGLPLHDRWDSLTGHLVGRERVEDLDRMLHAKVLGTVAVARLLADRPQAGLFLFSSVNAHFGGSGFGAYAAANSFLEGFADYWANQGRHVQSLAWSQWTGVGMNIGSPAAMAAAARGFRPIAPAQGLASMVTALCLGHRHLLIGVDPRNPHVSPLLTRRATQPRVAVGFTSEEVSADTVESVARAVVDGAVSLSAVRLAEIPRDGVGSADPAALTRLVRDDDALSAIQMPATQMPATQTESEVARICGDVLGHAIVGRAASLFEMGASSLMMMRLQVRVAERFGPLLPLRQLYERPTVCAIAQALDERRN
jgi:hypothetical protein